MAAHSNRHKTKPFLFDRSTLSNNKIEMFIDALRLVCDNVASLTRNAIDAVDHYHNALAT